MKKVAERNDGDKEFTKNNCAGVISLERKRNESRQHANKEQKHPVKKYGNSHPRQAKGLSGQHWLRAPFQPTRGGNCNIANTLQSRFVQGE